MRRSVYCTASFSVCSLQGVKLPIIDPPFSSTTKLQHYQIAREGQADPKPFMVALAICISTSFCTPVAHEATMLVMVPGRYRFKHYLSIGSGMAVIAWLLTTL